MGIGTPPRSVAHVEQGWGARGLQGGWVGGWVGWTLGQKTAACPLPFAKGIGPAIDLPYVSFFDVVILTSLSTPTTPTHATQPPRQAGHNQNAAAHGLGPPAGLPCVSTP